MDEVIIHYWKKIAKVRLVRFHVCIIVISTVILISPWIHIIPMCVLVANFGG